MFVHGIRSSAESINPELSHELKQRRYQLNEKLASNRNSVAPGSAEPNHISNFFSNPNRRGENPEFNDGILIKSHDHALQENQYEHEKYRKQLITHFHTGDRDISPKSPRPKQKQKLAPLPHHEYNTSMKNAIRSPMQVGSGEQLNSQSMVVEPIVVETSPNKQMRLRQELMHRTDGSLVQIGDVQEEPVKQKGFIDINGLLKHLSNGGQLDPQQMSSFNEEALSQILAQKIVKNNIYSRSFYEPPKGATTAPTPTLDAEGLRQQSLNWQQLAGQATPNMPTQIEIVNQFNITINQTTPLTGPPPSATNQFLQDQQQQQPVSAQYFLKPQNIIAEEFNQFAGRRRIDQAPPSRGCKNVSSTSTPRYEPASASLIPSSTYTSRKMELLKQGARTSKKQKLKQQKNKQNTVESKSTPLNTQTSDKKQHRGQEKISSSVASYNTNVNEVKFSENHQHDARMLSNQYQRSSFATLQERENDRENDQKVFTEHTKFKKAAVMTTDNNPMVIQSSQLFRQHLMPYSQSFKESVSQSLSATSLDQKDVIVTDSEQEEKRDRTSPRPVQPSMKMKKLNTTYNRQKSPGLNHATSDLHRQSECNRDQTISSVPQPSSIIGTLNQSKVTYGPPPDYSKKQARQQPLLDRAKSLEKIPQDLENQKRKNNVPAPCIVNPKLNYPWSKLPFQSKCSLIMKGGKIRPENEPVPQNVLLLAFDGVIGSYFSQLEFDANGHPFPEHSWIWANGQRFDNLFVRTGVAQGLQELVSSFRIVILLTEDYSTKQRLKGIKQTLKSMDVPFDSLYQITRSTYNYFSLDTIQQDFNVTSTQIIFVSAIVNAIGKEKADYGSDHLRPEHLNLLPLAGTPQDEGIVILGVPHLRAEISEQVDQCEGHMNKDKTKAARQSVVCDFKAVSHTVLNFFNISKSYHDEANNGSKLSSKSQKSPKRIRKELKQMRPLMQEACEQQQASNFFDELTSIITEFNTDYTVCLEQLGEFLTKKGLSIDDPRTTDQDETKGRSTRDNFQEAFEKAKKYELFSLSYYKPKNMFSNILTPEFQSVLLPGRSKIMKSKDCIRYVKAREKRLIMKQEEGVDTTIVNNPRAIANRYDNMRRQLSHLTFQKFFANWQGQLYDECNIRLPSHPTIEQLQKINTLYERLVNSLQICIDKLNQANRYNIMFLQSHLYSQTNLIKAHQISLNRQFNIKDVAKGETSPLMVVRDESPEKGPQSSNNLRNEMAEQVRQARKGGGTVTPGPITAEHLLQIGSIIEWMCVSNTGQLHQVLPIVVPSKPIYQLSASSLGSESPPLSSNVGSPRVDVSTPMSLQ